MRDMEDQKQPLHLMVLPFPALGHVNPMFHLSTQLASRGFIITFVNTHGSHQATMSSNGFKSSSVDSPLDVQNIRFVSIPDGTPEDTPFKLDTSIETFMLLLNGIKAQQHLLEKIVRTSSPPIVGFIADIFFDWSQAFADQLGIERVTFSTSNVASFYVAKYLVTGKKYSGGFPIEHDLMVGKVIEPRKKVSELKLKNIDKALCILVNSMCELESDFLDAAGEGLKPEILCIGPLIQEAQNGQNGNHIKSSNLLREEVECLEWLDKQNNGSVIYVAFGSIVNISKDQIEQIALGIEATGKPFIWVTRSGTASPDVFRKSAQHRGLIVSWAPQTQILKHPAVACFVTHCGWNSILESLYYGVPMLCFPVFADQPLNMYLIANVWQAGIALPFDNDQQIVANASNIHDAVLKLLQSHNIASHAARWKYSAHKALREGGSSWLNLQRFVELITNRIPNPN